MAGFRVGQGFDVHRLAADPPLVLCGVVLPNEPGLAGHSDADVAVHAICDAVYGAVAAGDLGEHFPSSEPRWRGVESTVFLEHAVSCARDAGFVPGNCDVTIIGNRPRIAPHRAAMRRRLAALLGVDVARVSVKATTTDGLGSLGRGDGLAAAAVVLLERVDDG